MRIFRAIKWQEATGESLTKRRRKLLFTKNEHTATMVMTYRCCVSKFQGMMHFDRLRGTQPLPYLLSYVKLVHVMHVVVCQMNL